MCGCGRQLKLDIFFPGNMLNPDQVEYKITRLQDVTYSITDHGLRLHRPLLNAPMTLLATADPDMSANQRGALKFRQSQQSKVHEWHPGLG